MTPVRVYGGGLSCAGSGVVDSACRGGAIYDARPRSRWRIVGGEVRWCCAVPVFGRHKWRPYVFAAGWGCGGVFIAFALFRCCCAVPVFGRHKWRPYVFAAGWGCGGVFIAFAPFGCSGVINGAPTFFCERDGNSCRPGCRSCRFDCFSWRCACPWMRCGGCFSVAVRKNCRFENNFHWKLCRLKSCLYLCRRNP